MSFLKRLFGGSAPKEEAATGDPHGVYFYIQCDRCQAIVRSRADKRHDLNQTGDSYTWHKTIVDSRCFRPIRVVVHLGRNYEIVTQEIDGGRFVTEQAYEASQRPAADEEE